LARACRGPPSPPSRASPCISAHHGGGGLYPYHPPYQGEYHGGEEHGLITSDCDEVIRSERQPYAVHPVGTRIVAQ
jgi:hypothetical protein